MNIGFSTWQVMQLTGATKQQIQTMRSSAMIVPGIWEGHGRGSSCVWSFVDAVGIKVIVELRLEGLEFRRLHKVLPRLVEFCNPPGGLSMLAQSRLVLLTDGKVAIVARDESLMGYLHQPGQMIMAPIIVDLRPAMEEVQWCMRAAELRDQIAALKSAGVWLLKESAVA